MRFSTLVAPIAFAATALAQSFSIATPPSLVQCQPVSLTWTGGSAPYTLAAIPAGQTAAAAISFIATSQQSSPYTWTVNLPTGLGITLKITDASGNNAYSSPLTIQAGASSSCLNTSASTSGLSTSAVSSTSGSASASASSTMSMSSAMSSVGAVSSSASSAGSAASSAANSATSAAGSAASAASSVAASATSRSGAFATAVAGLPALAAGAIGAVAVLV